MLGRTAGVVEALVRFAECKCLLGGVTTSQGITLASAGGIRSIFQGLIRNVEHPDDPGFPGAGTRIANPDTGRAEEYLDRAAKESGILMGIGCDWAPSGSKNLLGEIKTAWLASEEEGGIFIPEEIVAMATINAAEILKWDHLLGSIEPGKRADLVCLNGANENISCRML